MPDVPPVVLPGEGVERIMTLGGFLFGLGHSPSLVSCLKSGEDGSKDSGYVR